MSGPIDWDFFGAFITNPISRRPRLPSRAPAAIEYPGGVMIHTGLPNPGFRLLLKQYSRAWMQAPLPIIVNLIADRPEETRQMVLALEDRDNIVALQLGFAPLLADELILLSVELSLGELPLIVSLPLEQVLRLGPQVEALGAATVSIAPPRGSLAKDGHVVSGRLFGPSLFPRSLELVQSASKLGLKVIASGGVTSMQDAQVMLGAGALAVEFDVTLWLPFGESKSPVN